MLTILKKYVEFKKPFYLFDDQNIVFLMGCLFIPIYLSKEIYLIEFEKGNNLFIRLLKAIIYGFVLLIIGTIFLID